jgi:hypothetical protein
VRIHFQTALLKHQAFDTRPQHAVDRYDFVITVASDQGFSYELAGHLETGKDSISDPAMGGLL